MDRGRQRKAKLERKPFGFSWGFQKGKLEKCVDKLRIGCGRLLLSWDRGENTTSQKNRAGKLTIPYEFLVHRPRSERRPGDQWRRVAVEVVGVEGDEDSFVQALALALRPAQKALDSEGGEGE